VPRLLRRYHGDVRTKPGKCSLFSEPRFVSKTWTTFPSRKLLGTVSKQDNTQSDPDDRENDVSKALGPDGRDARPPSACDFGYYALHCALQGLVQRGFGFLVFLLRDSALLVFDLELEDLFFQGSKQ
jgi:hypothetical protein